MVTAARNPPFDDATWLQRLASARSEHGAGGGTVLDALLRHWPGEPEVMLAELEARSGVAALDAAVSWEPVLDRWSVEQSRTHQCVVLRAPGNALVAAAADPWAPAVHRVIERALGQ